MGVILENLCVGKPWVRIYEVTINTLNKGEALFLENGSCIFLGTECALNGFGKIRSDIARFWVFLFLKLFLSCLIVYVAKSRNFEMFMVHHQCDTLLLAFLNLFK